MHRFPRLRRVRAALAIRERRDFAFPVEGPGRHTEVQISELNSWPAFPPLPDAQRGSVTLFAPPVEAIAVG